MFQFVFRSFYRLDNAGLSDEIKNHFFKLMANKQTNLVTVLSELYNIPTLRHKNTIQFSFATKLLHTTNNDNPIFDAEISRVINKNVTGKSKDEKIRSSLEMYNYIQKLYSILKEDEEVNNVISKFRSKFNVNTDTMGDTKILDFIMWSLGKLMKRNKMDMINISNQISDYDLASIPS